MLELSIDRDTAPMQAMKSKEEEKKTKSANQSVKAAEILKSKKDRLSQDSLQGQN